MSCVLKGSLFQKGKNKHWVDFFMMHFPRRKPAALMVCVTARESPIPAALASHAGPTRPNTPGPQPRVCTQECQCVSSWFVSQHVHNESINWAQLCVRLKKPSEVQWSWGWIAIAEFCGCRVAQGCLDNLSAALCRLEPLKFPQSPGANVMRAYLIVTLFWPTLLSQLKVGQTVLCCNPSQELTDITWQELKDYDDRTRWWLSIITPH